MFSSEQNTRLYQLQYHINTYTCVCVHTDTHIHRHPRTCTHTHTHPTCTSPLPSLPATSSYEWLEREI